MAGLAALTHAIEAGGRVAAAGFAADALDAGLAPEAILDSMTSAMQEVGGRFPRNEIYVPEMLIAARATKEAMAVLEPSRSALACALR